MVSSDLPCSVCGSYDHANHPYRYHVVATRLWVLGSTVEMTHTIVAGPFKTIPEAEEVAVSMQRSARMTRDTLEIINVAEER